MLYCHFHGDDPFPRSVMRLLFERYPDVQAAFERAGLFVIEFEVSVDELFGGDTIPNDVAEASAAEAYLACPEAQGHERLLFLAHTSSGNFRELGASALKVPGRFLGACGYVEGGIHFCGSDGTFVPSDDWLLARELALRIASGA